VTRCLPKDEKWVWRSEAKFHQGKQVGRMKKRPESIKKPSLRVVQATISLHLIQK
jgi:hypothetical protein